MVLSALAFVAVSVLGVCSCLLLAFVAGGGIVALDIDAGGASQMLTHGAEGGGGEERDHTPNGSTRNTIH